jgi:hypothetical protein
MRQFGFMNGALRNAKIYLVSVTSTALCVTILYDLESIVEAMLDHMRIEFIQICGTVITTLILSWPLSFLFALPVFILMNIVKSAPMQSLRSYLLIGAVMGIFTSIALYSHAPEGPPNQTLGKMALDLRFCRFAVCVVISAVFGSFVYWNMHRQSIRTYQQAT